MKNRVAVTGLGSISSLGDSTDKFFESVCNASLDFRKIEFPEDYPDLKIYGSYIEELDPKFYLGDKNFRPLDRTARLSLIAATQAVESSKWDKEKLHTNEVGLSLGTMFCSLQSITHFDYNAQTAGVQYAKPLDFANTVINAAAGQLAIWFGLTGPNTTVTTGYTSSAQSCLQAYKTIIYDQAKALLVGGVEELSHPAVIGISRQNNLAIEKEHPLPFDKNRSGFLLGEGSFFMMLESLESCQGNKNIEAEILGGANKFDISQGKDKEQTVSTVIKTINEALAESNISADKIDFVYASANGSETFDDIEAIALSQVFENNNTPIPTTAVKSITGDLLGASGAMQAVCAIKTLQTGKLPGTPNLTDSIIDSDKISVSQQTIDIDANTGLVINIGMDGLICVMVVGKLC